MTYNEIMKTIETSNKSDWKFSHDHLDEWSGIDVGLPDIAIWFFKNDVDLRIEGHATGESSTFRENWTMEFVDKTGMYSAFTIYYDNTPIKSLILALVMIDDDICAFIPIPNTEINNVVGNFDFKIAAIIEIADGSLDESMARAGFSIE